VYLLLKSQFYCAITIKSIKLIYIRLLKKKLKPFLFIGQPFNSKVIMLNDMFMNIIQISEILNSIVLQ